MEIVKFYVTNTRLFRAIFIQTAYSANMFYLPSKSVKV